jgi:adenylate kinase
MARVGCIDPEVFLIVLLFGPPGCGKGTQASLIAKRYRIPAISTGELFRAECQAATALGRQARSIMAQGGLVGDELVNRMVANRISEADCRSGFLLDGFPRTKPQAEFFDAILFDKDLAEPTAIHLEVRSEVLLERICARRQCPACSRIYNLLSRPPRVNGLCDADGEVLAVRPDDTEEVIHQRLQAYEEVTGPVIAHYRGERYFRVNGEQPAVQVHREIARLLAGSPPWTGEPKARRDARHSDWVRYLGTV